MKIGDEVYIHGYVDEIRNDVVIIRNDGGYFGTVEDEVLCFKAKFHKGYIEPKVVIEPTDESQPDWYWKCPKCDHIVPNEFDECVWCLEPKPMKPKLVMPKKCKGCDFASKIIEAYSRGFEDGAEAVKAMPQTERSSE